MAAASGASWSIIAAIVVTGIVCGAAGWIGWTLWHRHKQESPATVPAESSFTMVTALASLREKLKGWRTVLFGGVVTIAGAVLDILDALHLVDISPPLPPDHALKIIAVIGIVTVVLRLVTTGRVGSKDC